METANYTYVWLGLVSMGLSLFLVLLGGKPSVRPTRYQALLEGYVRFVRNMLMDNIGEKGLRYTPLIASLGLFIFFSNLLGMVPGLEAPTGSMNINLAMALIVFLFYNFEGIRNGGTKYFKHFLGPNKYLAPFFVVVEIISHLSRPITLSLRLFANMKGGAILLFALVGMVIKNPFAMALSPVVLVFIVAIKFLAVFIQTYVFMILSVVYLAGAVSHEEH